MESTVTTEATPQAAEAPISDVPAGMNPAYMKKDAKLPVNKEPEEAPEALEEKKVEAALKKLKVRGKEIEVDEDKYHAYAQKGAAAEEKWQEAARMRKEAEEFMTKLKSNPLELLKDPSLGVDFRKIAEDYIWEQMQEENLSPEDKQRKQEMKELEELRAAKQKQQTDEEEQRFQQEVEHFQQDYDKKLTQALMKSDCPKNTYTVRRIADYMNIDIKAGVERPIEDYIERVEMDYAEDFNSYLDGVPVEKLIKIIGDKRMKKVREHELAKLKSPQPASGHTFVPGKGMVANKPAKKLSGHDWQQQIMKEMRGL